MFLTGCLGLGSSKTPATTTSTSTTSSAVATLQDRVQAAESRLSAIESKLNTVNTDETKVAELEGRIDELESEVNSSGSTAEIADLQAQIDALAFEVEALTSGESNGGGSTPADNEPIRWRLGDPIVYNYATDTEVTDSTLFTDAQADDPRLDEEGAYYVDLIIRNTGGVAIPLHTFYIKFTMIPYTGEYALLDESETYIDTDSVWVSDGTSLAEPSWDASFDTRERDSRDITKKVVFESDRCANSSFELDPGVTIKMTLYLELYYAD